jgi:hypothetical protein
LRAEGLAIPPGEEFEQKLLHAGSAGSRKRAALMPPAGPIVQTDADIPALRGNRKPPIPAAYCRGTGPLFIPRTAPI